MTVLKNAISDLGPEKRKSPVEIEEAIRRRAYEFYEQRGYVDGDDVEDWLVAEQEVSGNVRQDKRAVKTGLNQAEKKGPAQTGLLHCHAAKHQQVSFEITGSPKPPRIS